MSPRNLGWQDGWLIWRYRGRMVCLSARRWATGRCGWPGGWWGVFRPPGESLASVSFADGLPLLARAEVTRGGQPVGWLTHLAPAEALEEAVGALAALLEHMARQAGRRGARYLAAETPAEGTGLAVLQKAGLLPLTHLTLWRWTASRPPASPTDAWRPLQPMWLGAAQSLWLERVPPAVRPVIAQPQAQAGWWVLPADRTIGGVAWVDAGPGGVWVQVFLHPSALPQGEHSLASLLHQVEQRFPHRPVWLCTVAGDGVEDQTLTALGLRRQGHWLLLARPVGLPVSATAPARAEQATITHPLRPIVPHS